MDQEKHHRLVEQYKENSRLLEKFQKRALILEVFVIVIVGFMKFQQNTASLRLNIIATSFVFLLLFWHFWNSEKQRTADEKSADIILEGVKIERQSPFLQLTFFQNGLREFNVIGALLHRAIFDILLVFFFSISLTQLLHSIDPMLVAKLRFLTPISTWVINLYLGWVYYKPFKPLISLKKSMRKIQES